MIKFLNIFSSTSHQINDGPYMFIKIRQEYIQCYWQEVLTATQTANDSVPSYWLMVQANETEVLSQPIEHKQAQNKNRRKDLWVGTSVFVVSSSFFL